MLATGLMNPPGAWGFARVSFCGRFLGAFFAGVLVSLFPWVWFLPLLSFGEKDLGPIERIVDFFLP